MGIWTLRWEDQVPLVNAERSAHWSKRAKLTASWRQAFWGLAREQRVPALESVRLTVRHEVNRKGRIPDPVACLPAYKAAVDGLVDAKVIPDDDSRYVRAVTFEAPEHTGVDALELTIEGDRIHHKL
jgi:hypothetical protein